MALKRPASPLLPEGHRKVIELARKKFRNEQPESSADSVKTHESHILFYDSFENYPLILEEGSCKIYPKDWALAFLQQDIGSIGKILFKSIFTKEDIQRRNASENRTLPFKKRLAIIRAAKWLMNKNQDPWTYQQGSFPNEDEEKQLDEIFREFNEIKEISAVEGNDFEVLPAPSKKYLAPLPEVMLVDRPEPMNYEEEEHQQQLLCHDLSIEMEYVVFYEKIMNCVRSGETINLGNSAQTAKALTKLVIKQNTDIFVDAVQFSNTRWAKAIQQNTVEKIAEVLFRKYLHMDFKEKCIKFNNMDQFSPPKFLALIRAVAWIKQLRSGNYWESFGFDSKIPEHNVFLTFSEINRIYNFLTEKYGTGPLRPELPEITPTPIIEVQRSTCIVSPTPLITPPTTPTPSLSPAITAKITTTPNGDVVIHGHTFPSDCWSKALRKFRLDDGAEKAGKYLLEETFTDDEIVNGTISGRNDTKKFCEVKVAAILGALECMNGIIFGTGVPISLSDSEKKNLTKKIFTEHRNYLARRNPQHL